MDVDVRTLETQGATDATNDNLTCNGQHDAIPSVIQVCQPDARYLLGVSICEQGYQGTFLCV